MPTSVIVSDIRFEPGEIVLTGRISGPDPDVEYPARFKVVREATAHEWIEQLESYGLSPTKYPYHPDGLYYVVLMD